MSIAICTCGLWLVLASFSASSDPSYNRYLEMKMLNALWKQAVMHLTISGTYQGQELLPHCPEFVFSLQCSLPDTGIHSSGVRSQRGV